VLEEVIVLLPFHAIHYVLYTLLVIRSYSRKEKMQKECKEEKENLMERKEENRSRGKEERMKRKK
jgi:hypothetical protein